MRRDSHRAAHACALPTDARADRVLLMRERLRVMRLLILLVLRLRMLVQRLRLLMQRLLVLLMRLMLVLMVVIPVPLDRNGDEAIRGGQVQTEQRRVIEFGREKDVGSRRIARAHDNGGGGG